MSDLVKRLRSITDIKVLCRDCYKSFEAAEEAADRIEALEAALRLYAGFESNGIKFMPIDDKGGVARAILEKETNV